MFLFTGAAEFCGSFFLNHTPSPAEAFVSPLWMHNPSVKAMVSWGGLWLGGHHAGVGDFLFGLMKICKCLCISPEEVMFGVSGEKHSLLVSLSACPFMVMTRPGQKDTSNLMF